MDADQVKSRADFVQFVQALEQDLAAHPQHWENRPLPDFLEALGRWVEDMDGYYHHTAQPVPMQVSWGVLANMLAAARVYE